MTREQTTNGKREPQNMSDVPPETVLFIPFTPNSELKRSVQQAENEMARSAYGRVKVVETLGPKMNNSLSNTAPWRKLLCSREECTLCQYKPGQCRARNATYKVECRKCQIVYWRKSHRTLWD